MKRRARVRRAIARRPEASWLAMEGALRPLGLNEALLQNVQPPMPLLPSRLGQVKPASSAILCTRWPWRRSMNCPNVWM